MISWRQNCGSVALGFPRTLKSSWLEKPHFKLIHGCTINFTRVNRNLNALFLSPFPRYLISGPLYVRMNRISPLHDTFISGHILCPSEPFRPNFCIIDLFNRLQNSWTPCIFLLDSLGAGTYYRTDQNYKVHRQGI